MLAYFGEFCGCIKGRHAAVRPARFAAVALLSGVFLACAAARSAEGGDYTHIWTGGGGDGVWENPDNWDQATYPDGADDAALIDSGADGIAIAGARTLGALTLDADYSGTLTLGGTLTVNGATHSGNLNVNGGTLQTGRNVESGIDVAGTFEIGPGGTVVLRRSSTAGEGAGQTLTVGNLIVEGVLHADGQGFRSTESGATGNPHDRGGSHGGRGAVPAGGAAASTYGSMTDPTALGAGSLYGQDGGGAIIIVADSGNVTVDGTISANGNSGGRGNGAGGSINITAQNLAGTGTIRANGGTGSGYHGGGGRIAFHVSGTDTFEGAIRVNGGGGFQTNGRGQAGTIYLSAQKRANLVLGGAGNMSSLRLGTDDNMGPGGDYNYTFGNVLISDGGTLEIDGNLALNDVAGVKHGTAAVLIADTIEIEDGGVLSADRLGFPANQGPGRATANYDGGSYGGRGGWAGGVQPSYGSVTQPFALGSGGRWNPECAGAGAVLIDAGAVTNNGTISANGGGGARAGSGGSINIDADTINGSGFVLARGGNGNTGSGGGGRIAVVLTEADNLDDITFDARGGTTNLRGGAGTVYLKHAGHGPGKGALVIDNGNNPLSYRAFTELSGDGDDLADFAAITIARRGSLSIRDVDTLDFNQVAIMGDGAGYLVVSGTDGITFPKPSFTLSTHYKLCLDVPVVETADWTIPDEAVLMHTPNNRLADPTQMLNLTLHGNLTVADGGMIDLAGQGFMRQEGPGVGGNSSGGSHGGRGGLAISGPTYGSAINPETLGTGGYWDGRGGGAAVISVDGVMTIDGEVNAGGSSGGSGGSGGSINITAGSLAGNGIVYANGGNIGSSARGSGGGERVSVKLKSGLNFDDVVFQAYGGTTHNRGAAGTVYLETAAHAPGAGELRVRHSHAADVVTELPASHATLSFPDELQRVTLIIEDKGKVGLTADITVGDLIIEQ